MALRLSDLRATLQASLLVHLSGGYWAAPGFRSTGLGLGVGFAGQRCALSACGLIQRVGKQGQAYQVTLTYLVTYQNLCATFSRGE